MRALFFCKRSGGTFFRCGHCGEDTQVTPHLSGEELRRVRDLDKLDELVPTARQLVLGNKLIALICCGCFKEVEAKMSDVAPRSLPDLDNAGNLLGDF